MNAATPALRSGSKFPWRRALWIGVLVLLVLRIAAPYALESAVNRRLQKIPDYTGHVGNIDLSLIRGAYRLHDLRIVKRLGDQQQPFFSAKSIDFSIAWRDLVRGRLVSDIYVEDGHLTFVNSSTREGSQMDVDRRWQDTVQALFPINITHCEIHRGVLRFIDVEREPKVDLAIHDLRVLATALQNRPAQPGAGYPAHIVVAGTVLGSGTINIGVDLEPLADRPHFDLRFEVKGVDLTQLNDFLRAYGHVDVSKGTLQIYLEAKAANGRFDGYVKPFFQDLDFHNEHDKHDNLGKRIWESIVSGIATLVKNHQRNEVATQIPFSGQFENPSVGVFAAIGNMIENGFGRALSRGFNTDQFPAPPKQKLSETKG